MTTRQKIGDLLVASGTIDAAQLAAALGEQKESGQPLGMTLVRMGFLDEETLVNTLASQLKLPVVKLAGKVVNPDVLERVPIDLAEKHRCIPLLVNMEGGQQVLYLGMEDPANFDAVDELSRRTGDSVKPVLVAPSELEEALHRHYHWAESSTDSGVSIDLGTATAVGDADDEAEPEFIGMPGVATEPDQAPAASLAASGPSRSAGVSSESIVRALVQLLVEKGIITRDELVARVQSTLRKDDGAL